MNKGLITTLIFMSILILVALGVRGVLAQDPSATSNGDPNQSLEVKRRLGWEIGLHDKRHILTVENPQEVSLGSATSIEDGVQITIEEDGRVFMTWSPTAAQNGHHDQVIQIHNMTTPPFDNWTGELLVSTETVMVKTWAFPHEHLPFLSGGPDILVSRTR